VPSIVLNGDSGSVPTKVNKHATCNKISLHESEYGTRKSKVNMYIGKGKKRGVAGFAEGEARGISQVKLRRRMKEVNKDTMCNKTVHCYINFRRK
jgi:hypothetical protein